MVIRAVILNIVIILNIYYWFDVNKHSIRPAATAILNLKYNGG